MRLLEFPDKLKRGKSGRKSVTEGKEEKGGQQPKESQNATQCDGT